jgi:hypothetical protein
VDSQARVRIGVKWFLPRFAALGIAPGPKTGREVAPYGLEHNGHFWRGVIDGDGWVSPEGRVIGLVTASPVLRDQFVDFLDNAIGCRPTINIRIGGGLYQLTLTGANAAALASLLYEGSTFALSRKRAAATLLLNGERTPCTTSWIAQESPGVRGSGTRLAANIAGTATRWTKPTPESSELALADAGPAPGIAAEPGLKRDGGSCACTSGELRRNRRRMQP